MTDRALSILKETFGHGAFRGAQRAIVDAVVAGRDCIVLMPTGGGKSLCYQVPSLLREGVGIVVSPLIALMQDQVVALRELGVRAAYLNSTLSLAEQREVYAALASGALDLLYFAPERILQEDTLERLAQSRVALIAIDEAHCVSQWGHDFRADYLGLHRLRERFPGVPWIALTATADARTREEIAARLELDAPQWFVSSFDRPNIRYTVEVKTDPRRQLRRFLDDFRGQAGIVYCMSRAKVEETAAWLVDEGYTALPYHAGLAADVRETHQARFQREDGVIVVATIAFGMGIDKPDVRFVAHLDLPKSIEAYYQETGRAGRDGEPAQAWMVYGLQDVVRLRQMVDESPADEQHKRFERHKLDALLGWCEMTECRRRALLAYFGDTLEAPCGNCDNCLRPPPTWDATEAARQLLSCVYRTGQRFGAAHVVDVLIGKTTDKVTQYRHDTLSTFGLGRERSVEQWRSVIRQCVVRGLLRADVERYGALTLTETSRPLLRGETTLWLREDPAAVVRRAKRATPAAAVAPSSPLWEALRACRKRLADEHGVPPYVIFHDATLVAMASARPSCAADLLTLPGVGQAKLARYGDAFLEVLREAG
ncbi:MAG: DNA helicase RecQ [Gammaproteobacteria bacterium]